MHGFDSQAQRFGHLRVYGSDAPAIQDLMRSEPGLTEPLTADLPYVGAEVIWAVRHEMARTVEDVLSRRTRAVFLNVKAALDAAPKVASLIARELGKDTNWELRQLVEFHKVAAHFNIATAVLVPG
jgi:glycerol-3-phosphate dehydrogenase